MVASDSSEYPTQPLSSRAILRFISSPSYLLIATVVAIFAMEAAVMVVLLYLPPLVSYQEAFLDASILSLAMFPALYFLIFRPLRIHIALRQKAKEGKDALIIELQKALSEVKTLQGFIPICASCKKIRDDKGFWQQVEVYVSAHSDAQFSHRICPECTKKLSAEFEQDK